MITSNEALRALAREAVMHPQEEMLEVGEKKQNLYIGIPKETSFQENRVALAPEAVNLLVSNGHHVVVEANAGKKAKFEDSKYSEAGAKIAYETEEVYKADIVLKVTSPSLKEVKMMQSKQTLISSFQLSQDPKTLLKKLMEKKITAINWDFIKDEEGIFTAIRAMGEIAGNTSILIAAELLSNVNDGKGLMLGGVAGITPTQVVVLGAGAVGLSATRSALGLGASVKIFDKSISKLRRLERDLGQKTYTSIIQPKVLGKAISQADVVIGAIRSQYGRGQCIVTEQMVQGMKKGAVVVDISAGQGGCFETTKVTNHDNPTFVAHEVIHYCVPNVASRVSRTASFALSNIFSPILLSMADKGGCKEFIKKDGGFRTGVYVYNGILTNSILGEVFELPHKEIDLLLAAM